MFSAAISTKYYGYRQSEKSALSYETKIWCGKCCIAERMGTLGEENGGFL